jgi:hypothetical protein
MKMLILVFGYYSLAKCNNTQGSVKTLSCSSGRPNQYQYGKWSSVMAGMYGEPKTHPKFKDQLKWYP